MPRRLIFCDPKTLERYADELGRGITIERPEVVEAVQQALDMLPVRQRECVQLHIMEGFSYSETAKLLDIHRRTVIRNVQKGKQHLEQVLKKLPATQYLLDGDK